MSPEIVVCGERCTRTLSGTMTSRDGSSREIGSVPRDRKKSEETPGNEYILSIQITYQRSETFDFLENFQFFFSRVIFVRVIGR